MIKGIVSLVARTGMNRYTLLKVGLVFTLVLYGLWRIGGLKRTLDTVREEKAVVVSQRDTYAEQIATLREYQNISEAVSVETDKHISEIEVKHHESMEQSNEAALRVESAEGSAFDVFDVMVDGMFVIYCDAADDPDRCPE